MSRFPAWTAAVVVALAPAAASAQAAPPPLPPSAILTNYDRVLIGQEEAIESGAFVARVADSTAGWYNPAGLARVKRSIIGASATGYELDIIDLGAIQTAAGRVTLAQLPSFFGAVLGGDVIHSDAWRVGFSATKPTSWSASVNGATVDGTQTTYSSRVSISTLVPTFSVAWAPLDALRFGAGLGVAVTSITQAQVLSMRGGDPLAANASLRTADGTGSTWGIQGTFGVQWDVSEQFVVGASLSTPTLPIIQTGSLAYQSMTATGSPWDQSYFRDPDASFAYKLPLSVSAGLAWKHRRFEVEVDVRYHAAVPEYALLASTKKVETVSTGPDGLPVHTYSAFPSLMFGASSVWNVALGGHYTLDESWSLHGGFYTDAAPVAPAPAQLFRSVDLYGATIGAKLKGDHLSGSLGVGFSWGDSDNFMLGAPGAEGTVTTRLSIRSINLLYAIAYRF
jgi:long-subunit fatty acid transport protein